jgi:hypothetical protein
VIGPPADFRRQCWNINALRRLFQPALLSEEGRLQARSLTALASLTERGYRPGAANTKLACYSMKSIIPLLTSYTKYPIDYRRDMCYRTSNRGVRDAA